MESYRDFTLDSKTFAESDMKDFVEDLHKHKQKYVMIVDAAIAADVTSSYPPLEQGLEMDVFIKTEKGSASRGASCSMPCPEVRHVACLVQKICLILELDCLCIDELD